MIAYGAPLLDREPVPDLTSHGIDADVEPGRFLLYVSRLEPENQADLVVRAYRDVTGDVPLLIVGDAPYAESFKAQARATLAAGDPRVRLTGAIYGDGYRDLQRSALAYIQATSVGGTHPALVEAMAAGNLVLAFGTPENREVVAGTGMVFSTERELTGLLQGVVDQPDSPLYDAFRSSARKRAAANYSWDAVTDAYLALWASLGRGVRMTVAR